MESCIANRTRWGKIVLPPPLGHMLTSPLMRIRARPLMTSRPSPMLQLLGLWCLHQARRLHLAGMGHTRPMLQVTLRPGIMGATELK